MSKKRTTTGNRQKRAESPRAQPAWRPVSDRKSARPEWVRASLVDAAVVIGSTLATTLLLLLVSGQLRDTTAGNLMARSAAPVLGSTATPKPTAGQSVSGLVTPGPQPRSSAASPTSSPTPAANETANSVIDDTTIQAAILKKFQENGDLASSGIVVSIGDGTVTLTGTVPSDDVKAKIERLVRTVKGVQQVDNQIVVINEN